ncbi:class I SAM-dependent DNA methyltransferase [Lentisphaera marina]|uniref:type I restriction-modification system subunit M n=1 Tax=Lentisphaera marina TaxID=1111041 RepID=UPI0023661771|nr:class I SAM-dependent DNA methyltransferase [Lentisphaera marina]MDD7984697.1 class I SAM-dependent DNA methyltransferase [Lentisphaera marina]
MITGQLKNKIDNLWEKFWTGGIANPMTVIEQISYLMFARLLDMKESSQERKHRRLGTEFKNRIFDENQQGLRWSQFKHLGGEAMLKVVRDEVFPFFQEELANKTSLGATLKDAQFSIPKATLLAEAVEAIDKLPLDQDDTKGNLYEHLLSKLTTAGINGQFRTPRHIIQTMVKLVDPKPYETICDPACGTSGFLASSMEYLTEKYTSPEQVIEEVDEEGNKYKVYTGDQLEPYREHINNDMFRGFDFDSTMLRIASMNLMLHGIEPANDKSCINYQDSLAQSFTDRYPLEASEHFQVILANPPFKGSLDDESIHSSLKTKVKTKKTELLFLLLILRMLETGGRAAVVVPSGVSFGSSRAHVGVRQALIDENQLEAVISLPSGVFKPYAGVNTDILIFSKGGRTDKVWFYNVEADGLSLDDKRTEVDDNDLPDLLEQWAKRDPKAESDRQAKYFYVAAEEIRKKKYDLSFSQYQAVEYEEIEYGDPRKILNELKTLQSEIVSELNELEGMLG